MSAARHLWRCARCPAAERNVSPEPEVLHLPRGWAVAATEVLCSACTAEHYRRLGSPLHSGADLPPLRRPKGRELAALVRAERQRPRGARPEQATQSREPSDRAARWAALRAAVEAELRADPSRGNVVIAEVVGCVSTTVWRVRRRLEAEGVIPVVEATTSRDGRRQPARWSKARAA